MGHYLNAQHSELNGVSGIQIDSDSSYIKTPRELCQDKILNASNSSLKSCESD